MIWNDNFIFEIFNLIYEIFIYERQITHEMFILIYEIFNSYMNFLITYEFHIWIKFHILWFIFHANVNFRMESFISYMVFSHNYDLLDAIYKSYMNFFNFICEFFNFIYESRKIPYMIYFQFHITVLSQ